MDYLLSNPEQSCWVLDGYDGFHSKLTRQEVKKERLDPEKPLSVTDLISGLLNRQLLPGCTVLVTCRAPCRDLEGLSDKVGQLLGWDCHDIKEYVHNFFRVKGKTCFYIYIAIIVFCIELMFSSCLILKTVQNIVVLKWNSINFTCHWENYAACKNCFKKRLATSCVVKGDFNLLCCTMGNVASSVFGVEPYQKLKVEVEVN